MVLWFSPAAVAGLDIASACTGPLGCVDVMAGESRTLTMTVTGLAPGAYSFDTVLAGFPTVREAHRIIVGEVPEPSGLALLGAGLIAFGWSRRRRDC